MNVQESLARWVCGLDYGQIPQTVAEKTKRQILNVLAGVGSGRSLHRTRLFSALEDPLLESAALSMAMDFDDYLFIGHSGHSCVLTALWKGRELKADGRAVLAAIVAANEAAARLGAACFLGPRNGQMMSFIHLLGSSVAFAKLLELPEEKMREAIGIALCAPDYTTEACFFEGDSKALTAAWPISKGLAAVRLAAQGARGPRGVLNPDSEFFRLFSFKPLMGMFEGLGRVWLSETLTYKKYPACAYFEPALDAAGALAAIDARRIRSVTIWTNLLTRAVDARSRPDPDVPSTLAFSLKALVDLCLLGHPITPAGLEGSAQPARKAALQALMERTRVRHDPALTRDMKAHFLKSLPPKKIMALFSISDILRIRSRVRAAYPDTPGFADASLAWNFLATRLAAPSWTLEEFPAGGWTMCFPARVEVLLDNGERLSESRRLPPGSANLPGGFAVAEKNFLTHCRGAASWRDKILDFESLTSGEIASLAENFFRQPVVSTGTASV